MKTGRPFAIIVTLMVAVFVTACSKVTIENYNQLEVGMRYDDVTRLLGKPTRCTDVLTLRTCTWGDERRFINVGFVADQVVFFNAENIK